MAEYDFHFTAEVMDGIFGEVITARGAWDTLGERLDNIEQGAGGDTYTKAEVDTMLFEKVDKVTGKGLSTNDFTNEDKAQITTNKNNILSLTANGGGKNKFNIDTATIAASNASYTKNSDGTINVTKSTNTVGQVNMQQAFLGETGTYIISGCPSGGSSTTYEMLIQSGNTVLARDYGEGVSVSLTNGTEYQFKVVVRESQTLSNKLFKPMISVEGGDYQPYAPSNRELYEMILALQNA
jgi:hypothetical protein